MKFRFQADNCTIVVSYSLPPSREQPCFYERVALSLPLLWSATLSCENKCWETWVGLLDAVTLFVLSYNRLTFMLHLKPATAEFVIHYLDLIEELSRCVCVCVCVWPWFWFWVLQINIKHKYKNGSSVWLLHQECFECFRWHALFFLSSRGGKWKCIKSSKYSFEVFVLYLNIYVLCYFRFLLHYIYSTVIITGYFSD